MSFRRKGDPNHVYPSALPVLEVANHSQARALLGLTCTLGFDGRYRWPGFGGSIDDLGAVTERLSRAAASF